MVYSLLGRPHPTQQLPRPIICSSNPQVYSGNTLILLIPINSDRDPK